MPRIYYEGAEFSGVYSYLNTRRAVQCTNYDILRCLIMIGGSNLFGSLFSPNFERFWEMVFRFAMGIAYLRWDRSGNLVLNRNFEILDPSDKVVISYKFGKAFAKFYSERVFHIANLHNVDPLIKQGIVILNPNSKKRADLIGQDGNGDWYVFEAKGRSRYVQVSDKQKAKRQAENIMLINNLPPRPRISELY